MRPGPAMSSDNPTYPISINTGIVDKPDKPARVDLAKCWQPIGITPKALAEVILRGNAIAPQYKDDYRKTANFIQSGFLAADVDRDMTLEQAKDHAFVQHHANLIHTTASHTADKHRFRIIFLLDEPIMSARDWADAQLGLALEIGSDRAVSDGARLFFGNTGALIFRIGRTTPASVVARLIARGRDARASRSPKEGEGSLPVNSVRRLAGPELVKVAGGELVRMDEIGVKVQVHCPHHDDQDPSAFTVLSRNGKMGIHCSACTVTFWSNDARDDYDFGGFDRIFEAKSAGQELDDSELTGLARFFPTEPKFVRSRSRFLEPFDYQPGITMVKSAKGSGKTEALKSLVQQVKRGEFPADVAKKDRPKSILLIGHRQSLIREAAAKLGIRCYLDPDDEPEGPIRTLAVCLDSLPKYNELSYSVLAGGRAVARRGEPYDLVIIDESEQVLSHLVGETIKSRLGVERCFDALMHEVSRAKAVYVLDADLGLPTAHALWAMRPQDWASRCRIIYNEPIVPEQKRVMRLHADRKFLEGQMLDAIRAGERCFVVSNSKRFIKTVERMIRDRCGDSIVMRVVTGDNSRDPATLRFLKDIKTEILKVQVVLATPSIGTGIDITFPDGACLVDRVFGFFHPFINTHTDIDQQLARVRNPGLMDVWVNPATFDFTCNIDIIKDDLARAYTVRRAVRGRRPDGMVQYDRDDTLLEICAHVIALQRASKNRLIDLFCQLREANGWQIERVAATASASPYKAAREMLDLERAAMLLNAGALSDDDYIDLDERATKGAALTDEERIIHEKNRFERVVGMAMDAELVEMNIDGRLLDRVEALADVVSIWAKSHQLGYDLIGLLLQPTTQPKGRLQNMEPARMIAVLMRSAGLTGVDGFAGGGLYSLDALADFVAVCRDNRTVIEEVFAQPMRNDFAEKPVRQLNGFLARVGLVLKRAKTQKSLGRKIRHYTIPTDLLDTMMRLARSRLAVREREEAARERARESGRRSVGAR